MLEVTVKTLDGKNKSFTVPDDLSVKDFKEKISNSIGIPADKQRLIYQGKVLQDGKSLNFYDVHGKVIHAVQRSPPSSTQPSTSTSGASTSASTSSAAHSAPTDHGLPRTTMTNVMGSFTLPVDSVPPNEVQNIVQDVLNSYGEIGRNSQVTTRSASNGAAVDVHINLGQLPPPQPQSESQQRISHAKRMVRRANATLSRLENPPVGSGSTASTSQATTDDSTMETDSPASGPTEGTPASATGAASESSADKDGTSSVDASAERVSSGEDGSVSTASDDTTDSSSESDPDEPSAADSSSLDPEPASEQARDNPQPPREQGTPSARATNAQEPRVLRHPRPAALGSLLGELMHLNTRLQPYLQQYQELMNQDPPKENDTTTRSRQRLCNLVSSTMHYTSHAYHSISDLMIDMGRDAPRELRAAPIPNTQRQPTAVFQQTIPVQAHINMSAMHNDGSNTTNSSTTSASNSTATSTSNSSSQSATNSSGQQPAAGQPYNIRLPMGPGGMPFPVGMPIGRGDPIQIGRGVSMQSPRPAGSTSAPGQPLASTDPVVFMEVGPQAVTINSISAHVVEANPDGSIPDGAIPTTSAASAGGTADGSAANVSTTAQQFNLGPGVQVQSNLPGNVLPPGIMNSILQQMGNIPGFPMMSGAQPDISANNASTATTNSTSSASGRNSTSSTTANSTLAQTSQAGTGTTSSGTSPHSSPGGTMPRGRHFHRYGMRSRGGIPMRMGGGHNPDPFLPCHSHHFLSQRLRHTAERGRALNRGRTQHHHHHHHRPGPHRHHHHRHHHHAPHHAPHHESSRESTQATPTQATPTQATPTPATSSRENAATNDENSAENTNPSNTEGLTAMIENIVGSIISQAQGQMTNTAGMPGPPITAIRMSANPMGSPPRPGAPMGAPNPFQMMFRPRAPGAPHPASTANNNTTSTQNSNQRATPTSATSTPASSTPTPAPAGGVNVNSTNVFETLSSAISQGVMQTLNPNPQQPPSNVADFVSGFGNTFAIPDDNSLASRLLRCVFSGLTLPDLMQIFSGNAQPVDGLRSSLQALVREAILHEAEPTDENIAQGVETVIAEFQADIDDSCAQVRGRDDIDFKQSLLKLERHHLKIILNIVMKHADNNTFGVTLMDAVKLMIDEVMALCLHTLENGQADLCTMVRRRLVLPSDSALNNPMINDWISNHMYQYIQTRCDNLLVPLSTLDNYIVRSTQQSMDTSEGASSATETTCAQKESSSSNPPKVEKSREVPACTTNGTTEAASLESMDTDDAPASDDSPASTNNVNSENPTNGWQTVVPPDWVPIISQDIARQDRETEQGPYSDAYINGMPAKRRKIAQNKRSRTEMSSMTNVIPEALEQAIASVGVEPQTSVSALTQEASGDQSLHEAFEAQVCSAVNDRITRDKDYNAEKYPNTEKFFKKK